MITFSLVFFFDFFMLTFFVLVTSKAGLPFQTQLGDSLPLLALLHLYKVIDHCVVRNVVAIE